MSKYTIERIAKSTGVTAAKGFKAAGVPKPRIPKKPHLTLVYNENGKASVAGVFTKNVVCAPPITVCRESLKASNGYARAFVVNTKFANAMTGEQGYKDAVELRNAAAEALGVQDPNEVIPASTGVIGQRMPVNDLKAMLPACVAALSDVPGGEDASNTILTTDLVSKRDARRVVLSDATSFIVGGMAKGSGMIHPNMATTLCFVTSDAKIAPPLLQKALQETIDGTFNCLTVDGDTSTNDMCAVMANGAAGGAEISENSAEFDAFKEALRQVLRSLARMIARDGEGATKLMTVRVSGAPSVVAARHVGKTIATSMLVKTAVHGNDANWGRVAAAAGRADVQFDQSKLAIYFATPSNEEGDEFGVKERIDVFANAAPLVFSEKDATAMLSRDEVIVGVDLSAGDATADVWSCDLSKEYVTINGDYRS